MAKRSVTQGQAAQDYSATFQLPPLEKPHFFCGQLLTDQDLNRLLQWTERKLSLLNSKRLGWGIVDGLTVSIDKEKKGGVIIKPGCAVDAQAHDILLGNIIEHNLEKVCLDDSEGCADLATDKPDSDQPIAVNLYIRHKANPAGYQRALGQDSCRDKTNCDYTYVAESFEIVHELVTNATQHNPISLPDWDSKFGNLNSDLLTWSVENVQEVKEALRDAVSKASMRQFCFMQSLYKNMTPEAADDADPEVKAANLKKIKREAVEIIFWLIQDARNSYLAERVHLSVDSMGVPLGRVWLTRGENNICDVIAIDGCAPWRRPYQPHDDPYTMLGHLNLAPFIWQEPHTALAALQSLGVRAELVPLTITGDLSKLSETLTFTFQSGEDDFYLFRPITNNARLQLAVLDTQKAGLNKIDLSLGKRVVGFYVTPEEKSTGSLDDSHYEPPQPAPLPSQPPQPPPTPQSPPQPPQAPEQTELPTTNYGDSISFPVEKLQEAKQKVAETVTRVTQSEQAQRILEELGDEAATAFVAFMQKRDTKTAVPPTDELTKIDYIGPKIADKLKEIGIMTHAAVDKLEDSQLLEMIPGMNEEKLAKLRLSLNKLLGKSNE